MNGDATEPTYEELLTQAKEALTSGQLAQAAKVSRSLTMARPRDPRGWVIQGLASQALGDAPEAINAFQRSLELDDRNLEVAIPLARLLHEQGRHDNALSLLNFVLLREDDAELEAAAVELKRAILSAGAAR
jgi:Flp pilus assembly protein TadD